MTTVSTCGETAGRESPLHGNPLVVVVTGFSLRDETAAMCSDKGKDVKNARAPRLPHVEGYQRNLPQHNLQQHNIP